MAMPKGHNSNAPKKGMSTRVDPIKRPEDIRAIKVMLSDSPRNYCLFTLGINTNLRASDLCRLTVEQVVNLEPMDEVVLKEKKTGKLRRINLNESCIKAIKELIDKEWRLWKSHRLCNQSLFLGQRGPIKPSAVHALVKSWCKEVGLKGNYGSHTLRKTWGYQQRVYYEVELPLLMRCFNHSNEKETLEYLCIQPEEIKAVYANEI